MSDQSAVQQIKDTTANPAPLGLLAFGMTTVMLNLHNGFGDAFHLDAGIFAMGLFFGGITQLMVGAMEWKKGNTFGTTAFASYGAFWIVLVGLFLMPKIIIAGQPLAEKPGNPALAAFLILWGTYTFFMFLGTLRLSRALQFVFGSLVVLFFLLAYEHCTTVSPGFKTFIGVEGIVCGASAIYTGIAQVLNEVYGKTVMPLGPMKK
ncbi:MAG: acetate uptake transporter [Phycisphaerales bacterium]